MKRETDYLVMTTDTRIGHHDHGSWTEHRRKLEAEQTAQAVGGTLYRRTITHNEDGERRETIRRISP